MCGETRMHGVNRGKRRRAEYLKSYLSVSDGQTRAVRLIVVGVVLVGLETVLKLVGIIS